MKKLATGELRFVAKVWAGKVFGVYDRARGSWPVQTPELGKVAQETSQADAEVEAERLNARVAKKQSQEVAAPKTVKAKKKQPVPVATGEDTPSVELDFTEIEGYEMTDEQRELQEAALKEELFK